MVHKGINTPARVLGGMLKCIIQQQFQMSTPTDNPSCAHDALHRQDLELLHEIVDLWQSLRLFERRMKAFEKELLKHTVPRSLTEPTITATQRLPTRGRTLGAKRGSTSKRVPSRFKGGLRTMSYAVSCASSSDASDAASDVLQCPNKSGEHVGCDCLTSE